MRTTSSFPKLKNPTVLSPMAGVTDVAFRELAKSFGAGMTYTEFVSSAAIVRGNKNTLDMIKTSKIEKPVGIQLFGGSVEEVVEAAKLVEKKFDVIDINCGCPAWKVIKTGAGSELLKKPEGIAKFVNKLASAVNKPVTIKIRIGVDAKNINAVEVAKLAEDAGAAAIAVHGRTQKQGYSGTSDWDVIKKVKDAVNIPVIGNGDVVSPQVFKKRLDESGVDAIMIARAAMINPYIFQQINDYLRKGKYDAPDKISLFFEYLRLAKKHKINYQTIKKHAVSFTKGIVDGSKLRLKLTKCDSAEELSQVLNKFQNL